MTTAGPRSSSSGRQYEIRHQDGLGAWRAGFQSQFDKSTAQAEQMKEGARHQVMLSVFSEAAPFTFTPKFQVSAEASLLTAALSRPLDLADGVYGAVGNALSLLLNRLVDQPKDGGEFKVRDQFDPRGYIPDDFFPVKTYKY